MKKESDSGGTSFIPGIHNYCDKWCERCNKTDYCDVYDGEKARPHLKSGMNIEEFSKSMTDSVARGVEIVKVWAQKRGIHVENHFPEELRVEDEDVEREAKSNEIVQTADSYMMNVMEWFEKNEDLFKSKAETSEAGPEADDIKECTDIITWDHTLIKHKIYRAVSGKIYGWPEILSEYPPEYDGAAKLSLLCIERSITAWMNLRKYFPEHEDEIMGFVLQLSHMMDAVNKEFPRAMEFKRPGLD